MKLAAKDECMMGSRAAMIALLLAGLGGMVPTAWCADEPPTAAPAVDDAKALAEFSHASEALYKRVSGSLIRVKLAAPRELMKEFEEWRKKQAGTTPGNGNPARRAERRGKSDEGAMTMPARTGNNAQTPFRRFLEQKLKESPDGETQARVRAILARMEASRTGQPMGGEVWGVVIDDQGDAVVAWGAGRENAGGIYRVVTADGTEAVAKYVGPNMGRGLAVLKLDSPGAAKPLEFAAGRPAGGELLMCMSAHQGAVGWVTAPAAVSGGEGRDEGNQRFAIFSADDHGPTYLFNTKGMLAGIGVDHFAMPMDAIKPEIQWIINNKKDIVLRPLGVKYDPVLPMMRRALPALGIAPAVVVKEVAAGSALEKAGLKKDDILVGIDDISIQYLERIQLDLATRSGSVPVNIFRGGKEITLEMPLEEPKPDGHKPGKSD
jgi:S1-C subfamily serine protease